MHEILTATRTQLVARTVDLESLISVSEKHCQTIADDANRQTKFIADDANRQAQAVAEKAKADIDLVQEKLEKLIEELAGVKHSTATIDAIAEAMSSETSNVTPINGHPPMTEAAAGAAMQRHQHEDDRQQAADPYTTFIGGGGLPEKKKP